MPLVTRAGSSGNVFRQDADPATEAQAGDIWSDTNANTTSRRNDADNAWSQLYPQSLLDNENLTFGTGSDATTDYDGTNLVINPRVVGSGDWMLAGGISLKSFLPKLFEGYFMGDSIDVIWTQTSGSGAPTFALQDGVDGGLRISTNAAANARGSINFNNIRNFDPANCTIWGVFKSGNAGTAFHLCGLAASTDIGSTLLTCDMRVGTDTEIAIETGDGTTRSVTASSVALSADPTPFKIVSNGADARLFLLVAGIWNLEVTKTTNLPTAASQPWVYSETGDSSVRFTEILYLRAQNDS